MFLFMNIAAMRNCILHHRRHHHNCDLLLLLHCLLLFTSQRTNAFFLTSSSLIPNHYNQIHIHRWHLLKRQRKASAASTASNSKISKSSINSSSSTISSSLFISPYSDNINDNDDTSSSSLPHLYEQVLTELESEKLYGNTPRLCELDSMANWLRKGKLNIAPKYQRGYVWKQHRASRLVITVLCNRIVPAIVLHERSKGIFDVVGMFRKIISSMCLRVLCVYMTLYFFIRNFIKTSTLSHSFLFLLSPLPYSKHRRKTKIDDIAQFLLSRG